MLTAVFCFPVWECELKKPEKVLARLRKELTTKNTNGTEKVIPYPAQEDAEIFLAAEAPTEYGTKKRKR